MKWDEMASVILSLVALIAMFTLLEGFERTGLLVLSGLGLGSILGFGILELQQKGLKIKGQ